MVKLLTLAALLAGISTYVLHSERASVTAPLPTTKFDQLNTEANVTMRSFHLPQVNGKIVPFCLSGSKQCGKPAADAFCHSKGFKEAFTFQRNELHGRRSHKLPPDQLPPSGRDRRCGSGASRIRQSHGTGEEPAFSDQGAYHCGLMRHSDLLQHLSLFFGAA